MAFGRKKKVQIVEGGKNSTEEKKNGGCCEEGKGPASCAEERVEENGRQDSPKDSKCKEEGEIVEENKESGEDSRRKLENKVRELEEQLKIAHEKYLRELAELENHQKRVAKERAELIKYQGEHILRDLLEVVDNFERALESSDTTTDTEALLEGVRLIYNQLSDLLKKYEVRAETSLGKPFDPTKHEALSQLPVSDKDQAGKVMEEYKKLYYYKDKLLRPAQTVVATYKAEEEDTAQQQAEEPKADDKEKAKGDKTLRQGDDR